MSGLLSEQGRARIKLLKEKFRQDRHSNLLGLRNDDHPQYSKKIHSHVLYAETSGSEFSDTTTETSLVDTGVGSVAIPANYFTAGMHLKVFAWGTYQTAVSAGTMTLRIKLNSTTVLASSAITLPDAVSNYPWSIPVAMITFKSVGSSGQIAAYGYSVFGSTPTINMLPQSGSTINTTIEQVLDVTAQFGTASADNVWATKSVVLVAV